MCGNPSRQFDNLTARHGMLNVSSKYRCVLEASS